MQKRNVFLGAFAILCASSLSEAAQVCGAHDEMSKILKDRFGETPVSMGLARDGQVVEVFASIRGDWTIVVTSPEGHSCLVSEGEAWIQFPPITGIVH